LKLLSSFLLALAIIGCKDSGKIPDNFDYGKTENGIYRNNYFNFQVPVPTDWSIQNKEQTEEIRKRGRKVMEEANKDFAEKINANDIRSATLLTVFKFPVDSAAAEFNPSFMMVAENLAGSNTVKSGEDYLEQAKSLMLQSNMGYKITPGFTKEKIGKREFHVMETANNYGGTEDVRQLYYATIDKGFALATIISFTSKEQEDELKKMIHQLKFD